MKSEIDRGTLFLYHTEAGDSMIFFPKFDAPFIIIGSHRSGTSWLSRALHESGIHMGEQRDHNEEAWHFLSLNQQAIQNAGACWESPVIPKKNHWPNYDLSDLIKLHFGVHQRRKLWMLKLNGALWGWKDPRNTFTLSHWLEVFPKAKVIHLVRDREEVIDSLLRRQVKPGEVKSDRLKTRDDAEAIWRVYVEEARKYSTYTNFLEVDYKNLKANNQQSLDALDDFCGVNVSEALKRLQH